MAVTTSNGDGFALYNGIKLPNVDSVWTDRVNYPYAIVSFTMGFGQVSLLPEAFSYDGNTIRYTGMVSYVYDPTGVSGEVISEWMFVGGADSGSLNPNLIVWSSYDIPNTANNSTFFAASAPIPLDGMTVIEWDGDTTGLVSSSVNTHYKVSDVVLSANDLVGSVIAFDSEALVVPAEIITNGEGYASIDILVLSCQNVGVSFVDNTFPEKGLYFINAFDAHLPFFAYPASGGGSGDDEDDDEGDTIPKEKHYCRINGTIYEVEGGTAKMGGTFCGIKSGTVLIDGTVYDFAFN